MESGLCLCPCLALSHSCSSHTVTPVPTIKLHLTTAPHSIPSATELRKLNKCRHETTLSSIYIGVSCLLYLPFSLSALD